MKSKKRHADRLSTLPDEMLQHILSHLTSEEVVQTSLLSHRWRDVYAGVPVVDLIDPKSGRNKQEQLVCFDQQVTGAILCKSPGTPISTFRLNAFNPPRDLLHQWILIAVSSGVEEIDVKLRYLHCSRRRLCPFGSSNKASADFDQHERKSYVKTQHHLFRCPTLRCLRLANWSLDLPPGGVAMSATLDTLCLARIMDPKDQLQQLLSFKLPAPHSPDAAGVPESHGHHRYQRPPKELCHDLLPPCQARRAEQSPPTVAAIQRRIASSQLPLHARRPRRSCGVED
jgi:hypothetical protein